MYLYWDKDVFLGKNEFNKQKIKVRFSKKEFKDFDKIRVIVTCWNKDVQKVEKVLNIINDKLTEDEEYVKFLKNWKVGL